MEKTSTSITMVDDMKEFFEEDCVDHDRHHHIDSSVWLASLAFYRHTTEMEMETGAASNAQEMPRIWFQNAI